MSCARSLPLLRLLHTPPVFSLLFPLVFFPLVSPCHPPSLSSKPGDGDCSDRSLAGWLRLVYPKSLRPSIVVICTHPVAARPLGGSRVGRGPRVTGRAWRARVTRRAPGARVTRRERGGRRNPLVPPTQHWWTPAPSECVSYGRAAACKSEQNGRTVFAERWGVPGLAAARRRPPQAHPLPPPPPTARGQTTTPAARRLG